MKKLFDAIGGWTSQFEVDGELVGGHLRLDLDERLKWQIAVFGGLNDKTILELGPLEGAHTKMMADAGADFITAIEGDPKCFLRCLIVKEAFNMPNVEFLYRDFCKYVSVMANSELFGQGLLFDIISASGVLYHQLNPAQLIYDMSMITDHIFVWSQVADTKKDFIQVGDHKYYGEVRTYGKHTDSYCGGLHPTSFWMEADEMRRCFNDVGFELIEKKCEPNVNGSCLLFIANKIK